MAPLSVPTTSVFSKADGVVGWQTCIEPTGERTENVRVWGSHAGMGVNPDVLRVIADRLAQDPDDWKPFNTTRGCRAIIYPAVPEVSA